MFVRQFYTPCLAQASYYIESAGNAAVIDPLRDIDCYIDLAAQQKAIIRYVFITHFHADFVSGQLELANKTGATIIFGQEATPAYPALIATDDETFSLGACKIKVLHTPGHTIESACFLLHDEQNNPYALFSGDTLFIGDVGRPDLLSGNLDAKTLAGMLYDSIERKIKPLPDNLILYPGHGAGSACGKKLSNETSSFIGAQKVINPAFMMNKEDFIEFVTTDQPPAPAYFFKDAKINKWGSPDLSDVLTAGMRPLKPEAFRKELEAGAQVLDTRNEGGAEHVIIKNAIHIGLDGQFAIWAGSVIDFEKPLLLVCDPGTEKAAITRLARIGFDQCLGYLEGGIEAWEGSGGEVCSIGILSPELLSKAMLQDETCVLLDVRRRAELEEKGSIDAAFNIPLEELKKGLNLLNKEQCYIVFCAGGYRSLIAASIMKCAGFRTVHSVEGGIAAIKLVHPDWLSI
ncbi:MAG: MBL fold metallo-hydrolase [Bacteroidota bacterium]